MRHITDTDRLASIGRWTIITLGTAAGFYLTYLLNLIDILDDWEPMNPANVGGFDFLMMYGIIAIITAVFATGPFYLITRYIYGRWDVGDIDFGPTATLGLSVIGIVLLFFITAVLNEIVGVPGVSNTGGVFDIATREWWTDVGKFAVMVLAVVSPAVALGSVAFYLTKPTTDAKRVVYSVGICVLLSTLLVGAAYVATPSPEPAEPQTVHVDGEDMYDEYSSVENYDDPDIRMNVFHDPYVDQQSGRPASEVLPCDDQPNREEFENLTWNYDPVEIVVNPDWFSIRTFYHTRDEARVQSFFIVEHTSSKVDSGTVGHEPTGMDPSFSNGRLYMTQTSEVVIYQDTINEDGEVIRYGTKLCRPDS